MWSERGPTSAANRPAFSSPETPIHAQGHVLLRISTLPPHARAFFLGLFLLLSSVLREL